LREDGIYIGKKLPFEPWRACEPPRSPCPDREIILQFFYTSACSGGTSIALRMLPMTLKITEATMASDGTTQLTSETTPIADERCAALAPEELTNRAQEASNFLKALAHEGRLMILCHLSSGEKSVTELENLLDSRQAAVSQQLARLRLEGLVACRRDGKAIYYSLSDPKAEKVVGLVYELYCKAP
jgi:DNA-binding transcriptional ArsR family regulator